MWRRTPPESRADRDDLAFAAAGLLLAGLLLLAALLAGCVPVRPACGLGTYLRRVDTDTSTGGAAAGSGTAVSGSGKATWRGAGSADWECRRVCYSGQLLKAARTDRGAETMECRPSRECPAGSLPPPTSATPPGTVQPAGAAR
jgi:hypothetical protein